MAGIKGCMEFQMDLENHWYANIESAFMFLTLFQSRGSSVPLQVSWRTDASISHEDEFSRDSRVVASVQNTRVIFFALWLWCQCSRAIWGAAESNSHSKEILELMKTTDLDLRWPTIFAKCDIRPLNAIDTLVRCVA